MTQDLVRDFLDRLEELEARLLVWGIVDAGFSREELLEHATVLLDERQAPDAPEDLVDAMEHRRLLFAFRDGLNQIFRTRSAETVRLMAKLRQLFPGRPWAAAPTLVADFRYDVRPRTYPSRHISPPEAITRVASALSNGLEAIARQAIEVLLGGTQASGQVLLADFQLTATTRVLSHVTDSSRGSRGLVVAAGTGTGKTLAFYLPALAHLSTVVRRGEHWTKALALYPRNELLKDQLSEAYRECRKLDDLLTTSGRRKLTVGAYFGPTPRRASADDLTKRWGSDTRGFTCPFLACPDCGGPLLWTHQSVQANTERLDCLAPSCGRSIGEDEIVLTRDRMAKQPPDVLFTTTEMLSRQLSDSTSGHVFGIGAPRPPQVVLLDEIHTYTGVHGAQVAHLLRRWRYSLGPNARVQFVGLSATLRNASEFFAQLVGINPSASEEIPVGDRIDRVGKEYHLILRGDPVSATSLLSVTIQAGMLLRRVLDPTPPAPTGVTADAASAHGPSGGMYGRRVYTFTDDLDVTNRLYHNLLDAEGRDDRRRAIAGQEPLASLRSNRQSEPGLRGPVGQSWRMCELIGFDLHARLQIGRTSSQDTGVDRTADITVATASLEVGFNDPGVGAVLQHKAPRGSASFLQRRGRAGRLRLMRPWTVVVLSDYGRDRAAYQGYEQLFDPVLDSRALPVENRYVLRMQAAYVLMDWLRTQIPRDLPGSVWRDLSGPAMGSSRFAEVQGLRQQRIVAVLEQLLAPDPGLRDDFARYLRRALQVPESLADSLLWERPRAVMTVVIPTTLRRLASRWRRLPLTAAEGEDDTHAFDHPLPDFIPAQLFGDLNLPEVTVLAQERVGAPETIEHPMPIVQAVRTMTPGRVTRRFAAKIARHSHWLEPPAMQGHGQRLSVAALCTEWDELGPVQVRGADGYPVELACFRPWTIRATLVPPNVSPTSNGFPTWATQIYVEDSGLPQEAPAGSMWSSLIPEVSFFVHRHGSRVSVRRFATGASAAIRMRDGAESAISVTYTDVAGSPGAVGFFQDVDGILIRYRAPADLVSRIMSDPALARASRTAYFRYRVVQDPQLATLTNSFQRDWLAQIYLSTLITASASAGSTLNVENARLRRGAAGEMATVMETIFQTLPSERADGGSIVDADGMADQDVADEDEDGTPATGGADGTGRVRQRMHDALLHLCGDPAIIDRLGAAAAVLWEATDNAFAQWLSVRFKSTLGEALLAACQFVSPHFAEDDLYLDLDGGPRPPGAIPPSAGLDELWITESTPGGGGVVEEILHRYADDPRAFFRLVESALGPGDLEIVDEELSRIVTLTGGPVGSPESAQPSADALKTAFADAREATGNEAVHHANRRLLAVLTRYGFLATHPVAAALRARVLRPGSSPSSDELFARLMEKWRTIETHLGVEIDGRVFAHLASREPNVVSVLERVVGARSGDPAWAFNTLYGLLWPRGYLVRTQSLRSYNPFVDSPETDRRVVLSIVRPANTVIKLASPDWRARFAEALSRDGTARLSAPLSGGSALKAALLSLSGQSLEVGFLSLFPQVVGMDRSDGEVTAVLSLREAIQ